MTFDTITDISLWSLLLCVLVVPALVFFAPRPQQPQGLLARFALAVLAAQASVYGMFLALIDPAVEAYSRTHPYSILDGILLSPPYLFCVPAALVSLFLVAVRSVYLALRDHNHRPPLDAGTMPKLRSAGERRGANEAGC